MELQAKRDFYELANEFKNNKFDLTTVSNLIVLVRKHSMVLSEKEAKILLEIPLNVLKEDVELSNKEEWSDKNGGYFAGNITKVDDDFESTWKAKFKSKKYKLEDITELCEIVRNDFEKYRMACEFLLRNVEFTLKGNLKVYEYSNFYKSGKVFSSQILKAIDISI